MLIVGIDGKTLDEATRARLSHPCVSGVILFSRNISDRAQCAALVADIRALRSPSLLVCVDQEGGPVQRCRDGHTVLPELQRIGDLLESGQLDFSGARGLAWAHALVMASEMRAIGFDLSFAPVLDLALGNRAIGRRAFSADPRVVAELGVAYVEGMHAAGMAATGKHFPGHGSVLEDTHHECALDPRALISIEASDLLPFAHCIGEAGLDAVMMAHVGYPEVDTAEAGYSLRWIGDILRGRLGFRGAVISDDIAMLAATRVGGIAARLHAHLNAGCDYVLVCQPGQVPAAIDACAGRSPARRDFSLRGRSAPDWDSLMASPDYRQARALLDLHLPNECHDVQ